MCRHIYNWNIIEFDDKQPIKQPTSLMIITSYNAHVLNYKTKVQLFRDRFKWLNKSPRKSVGGVVYRFAFEVVWCNEHHLRGYFETNKLYKSLHPTSYPISTRLSVKVFSSRIVSIERYHPVVSIMPIYLDQIVKVFSSRIVSIERYHPVVSIMPRYLDQIKTFRENLWCRAVKIDKILGWLTVLCSQMRQPSVMIAKISRMSERSKVPS